MNIVDWVLIGVLIVFAWAGWRQGFIAGLLSFIGFIGGGLLAAFILPDVIVQRTDSGFLRVAVLAISIILCAILGQLLTSFLGRRLRGGLTWRPVRLVDSLAGAALNVLGVAIVGWIVVSAVAYLLSRRLRPISGSHLFLSASTNWYPISLATPLPACATRLVPPQHREYFLDSLNLPAQTLKPRTLKPLNLRRFWRHVPLLCESRVLPRNA